MYTTDPSSSIHCYSGKTKWSVICLVCKYMQVKQSYIFPKSYIITIVLAISTVLLTEQPGTSSGYSIQKSTTSNQYRSGYAVGTAHGKKVGKIDGSGEAGTNSMHTNATCGIEQPKQKDFDRGYIRGCRAAYESTFAREYKQRQKK
jgi:hypothetical protein